jgi:uncharacterized protein YggE
VGDRKRRPALVTVAGVGHLEREPDIARATLTVEATRESAAEARGVAAATADAVIAALRAVGIGEGDLRTASIDVNPAWDHRDGGPVRVGFTVSSRLGVAIRDLDAVGRVIDAALGAGATGLDGVSFGVADPAPAAEEARRLAVVDARGRAATIAKAAGSKLGALVDVTEGEAGGPSPRPHGRTLAAMAMSDAATPVLPGRVEVTVSVVATWELD